MEKLSEEEIRRRLEKYPKIKEFFIEEILRDMPSENPILQLCKALIQDNIIHLELIEGCLETLYDIPTLEEKLIEMKNDFNKLNNFQSELREACFYKRKGFSDIEFLSERKGIKTPDFRVRFNNIWIYFEVKSFNYVSAIKEFDNFQIELQKIISHYEITIAIDESEYEYTIEMIREIERKSTELLLDCIKLNTRDTIYFKKTFINLEITYFEEEGPTSLGFREVSIKFVDLISSKILRVLFEAKEQLDVLDDESLKVIVIYNLGEFNIVGLPVQVAVRHFCSELLNKEIFAIIMNYPMFKYEKNRYVYPNNSYPDKEKVNRFLHFLES